MKRRDLLSGILGLPAMAGVKVEPVVKGESPAKPFLFVIRPDRPLSSQAIQAIRDQLKDFFDSSGVNAKGMVLPYGCDFSTVMPDGKVHNGDSKPWVGQVVLAWSMAARPGERRSFQVARVGLDGYHLLLLTHVEGSRYGHHATDDKVVIASNGEVDPYDALRIVHDHQKHVEDANRREMMEDFYTSFMPLNEARRT
jgi:hypothetical protein